ncbi:hypothetical protein MY04_5502 [Flammeovirga sp. MY04]|uniref:hypothetical protein n=1 Tax=Flammeovirga sp. MY04 TaxID=1191459 RepID=UPI00080630B7|nr:hypothetical protein [Flammeovirga sp. MY04]ANQ52833.1 hypothetical protein MY04_5502 [Flammeovirga sp. MY04]
MKNYIILLAFMFLSCNQQSQNTTIEFGTNYTNNLQVIDIDSTNNYYTLIETINKILCEGNSYEIQLLLHSDSINYEVNLINPCPWDDVDVKSRNAIIVKNDSISKYKIGTYKMDSLNSLLIKDFYNNAIDKRYCEFPSKSIIIFYQMKDLPVKEVKERIIDVLKRYQETGIGNEKFKLWLR